MHRETISVRRFIDVDDFREELARFRELMERAEKTAERMNAAYWNDYITYSEAAEYLNIKTQTLRNHVSDGDGPKHAGKGRGTRFTREGLKEWMEARK